MRATTPRSETPSDPDASGRKARDQNGHPPDAARETPENPDVVPAAGPAIAPAATDDRISKPDDPVTGGPARDADASRDTAGYDRADPRIHASPDTPAKPFTGTGPFWLSAVVIVAGCVIVALAQPAAGEPTALPGWILPVGYFTAVLGAAAMFVLWVRYRAR